MHVSLAAACGLLLSVAALAAEPVVTLGKEVRITYTVALDGRQVDAADTPVGFVVGTGTMMPGLEDALLGMHGGEEKTFDVPPEAGYGEIDPDAVKRVPLTALPTELKPEPGMEMEVRVSGGEALKATVKEVADNRVVLDFNHPLAGKTLTFHVKIVAIEDAKGLAGDYPRAIAVSRRYPDLLKMTSDGVVYAAVRRKPPDPNAAAELFKQFKSATDIALLQCGMQIVGVEVRGDILKTYSMLNTPTRMTLLRLVDRSTGGVTETKVVAALLAPYAGPEERNRKALSCELLLSPLSGRNKALTDQLKQDICPRVARLTACLADLHAADSLVGGLAGDHARRLYSGARWDSRVDYLDQLAVAAP